MGLCKNSNRSIFTFINASDLRFYTFEPLREATRTWKSLQNDDVTL